MYQMIHMCIYKCIYIYIYICIYYTKVYLFITQVITEAEGPQASRINKHERKKFKPSIPVVAAVYGVITFSSQCLPNVPLTWFPSHGPRS